MAHAFTLDTPTQYACNLCLWMYFSHINIDTYGALRAMHSTCSRHFPVQEHELFFSGEKSLCVACALFLNDAYSCPLALYLAYRNNDLPDNLCIAQAVSSTLHFYHSSRKSFLGLHHSSSCTLERENYSVPDDDIRRCRKRCQRLNTPQ